MLRYGLVFLALAGAIAAAPLEENEHSIQRRQIITFTSDPGMIVGSVVGAAVIFGILAVAWVVLAPLFGFRLFQKRRSSAVATPYPTYSDPSFTAYPEEGYYDGSYENSGSGLEYEGRSLQQDMLDRMARAVFNSVDIVEMALKYMSVEEEACKYKAVCKAEQLAVRNPIAKLAINTINSNLSGLAKYANAVEAGLNGEDCDLLYDQCRDRLAF